MDKKDARRIAQTIKNHELFQMFEAAWLNKKSWDVKSAINKQVTKKAVWDLIGKNFDLRKNYHILAKTNMIAEFGEYLPGYLLLPKELI